MFEMDQITPKEVKILENPEDIQERREQVLSRYANFKAEARNKRDKLEDSRRFQVCSSCPFFFLSLPDSYHIVNDARSFVVF